MINERIEDFPYLMLMLCVCVCVVSPVFLPVERDNGYPMLILYNTWDVNPLGTLPSSAETATDSLTTLLSKKVL